jgi:hypothetical protein
MVKAMTKNEEYREIKPYWDKRLFKHYDAVEFVNGYGKHRPRVTRELYRVTSGQGFVEWGAPRGKTVYILALGKRIS